MAERLLDGHRDVGAVVSECTNLAPHSAAIERRFGVPVFDIVTLVNWLQSGLRPRRFPRD